MSKKSTHDRGSSAEGRAARHLRLKGYRILERNWRVAVGEIDLIVRRGGTLAFVEVKMRRSRDKGSPLEAVDERKRARIGAAAACYLARGLPKGVRTCRFDVLAIGPEMNLLGLLKVRHLENAFEVPRDFNV